MAEYTLPAMIRLPTRSVLLAALSLCAPAPAAEPAEGDNPADRLPPTLGRGDAHRPYFEVLAVSPFLPSRWQHAINQSRRLRRPEDDFIFEMVMVGNVEDAICAALLNADIAAVLLYEGFGLRSSHDAPNLRALLQAYGVEQEADEEDLSLRLANILKRLRPELDIYLLTDRDVEKVAGDQVLSGSVQGAQVALPLGI